MPANNNKTFIQSALYPRHISEKGIDCRGLHATPEFKVQLENLRGERDLFHVFTPERKQAHEEGVEYIRGFLQGKHNVLDVVGEVGSEKCT